MLPLTLVSDHLNGSAAVDVLGFVSTDFGSPSPFLGFAGTSA